MDETETPTTGDELAARWAFRDAQYATMRTPMSPEYAEAVRQGRMREADRLPAVADRARMWARAQAWVPPVNQEFGSMRDWLDG